MHTLFLKRFHLFFLLGIFLLFVTNSVGAFIFYALGLVLLTDLRTYRVLNRISDVLNSSAGGQTNEQPLGVNEHIKRIFRLIGIFVLITVLLVVVSVIVGLFFS